MFFRQFLHEERACLSYLVGCPTKGLCAAIDPQGDPARYIREMNQHGMQISHILETHIHADHRSGALQLQQQTGAPIYLGPGSDVYFEHNELVDGQVLEVGNRRIRVIHTPGHTPEHVCLLGDDWYLLTGDTLFVGDVGRVDLAEGTLSTDDLENRASQLYQSLQKLLGLPDWTEVYPAHYAGSVCGRGMDGKTISTIGHERRNNPAFQMDAAAFIRSQTQNLPPLPEDFLAIKEENLGRGD
ncbi:MAG TPA: MBL fold metallo-hydrolase [Anaerolineaceae bacterium]|nr:MBL fold metallo-hydrolase [Anaerolineaceae bacterium]